MDNGKAPASTAKAEHALKPEPADYWKLGVGLVVLGGVVVLILERILG